MVLEKLLHVVVDKQRTALDAHVLEPIPLPVTQTSMHTYWQLFRDYIIELIHGMPPWVYATAFGILVVGGVVLVAVKGWKTAFTTMARLFLLVYVALLLCGTLVFRATKDAPNYRTEPFWHYSEEILSPDTIVNVLVFIPVGLALCPSFRRKRWWQAPLFGFALSVAIELLQLQFRKGCADVDDVIHNTLGCLIGCGVCLAVEKMRHKSENANHKNC